MGTRLGRTERLEIRRPSGRDRAEVIAAARASQDLHHPWVTAPTEVETYLVYLRRNRSARHAAYLFRTHAGEVVGIANVSDIVLGNLRSAHLGYYAFTGQEGRGLMAEGMGFVIGHAFTELGLHRLEVNIQPGNERSRRLAEACGFRLEGFSPRYLIVDGDWRDHERWAITAEDLRPSTP